MKILADLIMLGLATHEAYFTVLREEFKPNMPKPCDICKKLGHEYKNCDGEISNSAMPKTPTEYDSVSFIFIRIYVLRMYLKQVFSDFGQNSNLEVFQNFFSIIIFCKSFCFIKLF